MSLRFSFKLFKIFLLAPQSLVLCTSIILFCHSISQDLLPGFFIWNVGQGQWATWTTNTTCEHLDAGGEKIPLWLIRRTCFRLNNSFWLSHGDWDHINALAKAKKILPSSCVHHRINTSLSAKKRNQLNAFPICQFENSNIHPIWPTDQLREIKASRHLANAESRVLEVNRHWLVPGDSGRKEEIKWMPMANKNISHLLLGHHGSKNSTSIELIKKLTDLKQAIASSRKKKYGHPHPQVIARLKNAGVPVISTEDWGNIRFE